MDEIRIVKKRTRSMAFPLFLFPHAHANAFDEISTVRAYQFGQLGPFVSSVMFMSNKYELPNAATTLLPPLSWRI
ncbi:hypothetical protein SLA2020_172190 [Shorea laevis]